MIFLKAISSFDKLRVVYEGDEIAYNNIDTVKEYIQSFTNSDDHEIMKGNNEFDDAIDEVSAKTDENEKKKKNKQNIIKQTNITPLIDNDNISAAYNSDNGRIKQAIYTNISKIWTESRIITLLNIVDEVETNKNNSDLLNASITTLHYYMNYIDILAHNKIIGLT